MSVVVAQSISCLLLGLLCLSVSDVFLDLCCSLLESSNARRVRLEEARNFFQFLQDHEEEDSWLVEKQRNCMADISVKDLHAVLSLQQKHKVSPFAVCCGATQPLCCLHCWSQWDWKR